MALAAVFVKQIPFSNAAAGGLIGELWRAPAGTAGDQQTITTPFIQKIIGVVGPVEFTVLGGSNSAAIELLSTIEASNFADILVLGYAKTGPQI